ncbi:MULTISPECIES: SPW repeat domain-containing protein [unclassified Streptomyces]|uniref:SPW repeat domain-containing protein n=1 Tax=unclassified Streptomyces TaxID=2593676 RepID=UPI0006AECF5F|nr:MULTISPECIES: SPW repeat protein [unclassified Streptomyces]
MELRARASPWIAGFNGFTTLAYALLVGGLGNSCERTRSMAWAAVVIGVRTCFAPWGVAGDAARTRSITSSLIAGAAARDRTDNRHGARGHRSTADEH